MAQIRLLMSPPPLRAPRNWKGVCFVMFIISEAETAAVLAVYQRAGEWAAVVELRRLFTGIQTTHQPSGRCGPSCPVPRRWSDDQRPRERAKQTLGMTPVKRERHRPYHFKEW